MITLDTSAVVALANRRDQHHRDVQRVLRAEPRPWYIVAASLGEITYLIEQRGSPDVLLAFIDDLADGSFLLDCGDQDLGRIHALLIRYRDLSLGYVDAAVIACAERRGGRVLTFDLRHFGVVAREGVIRLLP